MSRALRKLHTGKVTGNYLVLCGGTRMLARSAPRAPLADEDGEAEEQESGKGCVDRVHSRWRRRSGGHAVRTKATARACPFQALSPVAARLPARSAACSASFVASQRSTLMAAAVPP